MLTTQRVATLAVALCTTRAVGAFLSTKAARCRYSTTTKALGSSGGEGGPHTLTEPLAPIDSLARPSALERLRLRLGYGKSLRERVVHKYFHGVDTRNISQIQECFNAEGATITDIRNRPDGSTQNPSNTVTPAFLADRCQQFLTAHPECDVKFYYSPTCGRGKGNNWVYAHWYEEGTWSGESEGLKPDGSPLAVQGQTRFWVGDDLKIKEIVITRTFSKWEEALIAAASADGE